MKHYEQDNWSLKQGEIDEDFEEKSARAYYDSDLKALEMKHREERDGERFLSAEKQRELAICVYNARVEVESRPELQEILEQAPTAIDKMTIGLNHFPADGKAKAAMNTLILDYLPYVYYRALTSVGIKKENSPRYPTFIGDIRKLRSERASIDDRVQEANLALIKAIWRYDPYRMSRNGKYVSLVSCIQVYLHAGLLGHVTGDTERSGGTYSPFEAKAIKKDLANWDNLTPKKQAMVERFYALQDPLQIEDFKDSSKLSYEVDFLEGLVREERERNVASLLDRLNEDDREAIKRRHGFYGDVERADTSVDERMKELSMSRRVRRALLPIVARYYRDDEWKSD